MLWKYLYCWRNFLIQIWRFVCLSVVCTWCDNEERGNEGRGNWWIFSMLGVQLRNRFVSMCSLVCVALFFRLWLRLCPLQLEQNVAYLKGTYFCRNYYSGELIFAVNHFCGNLFSMFLGDLIFANFANFEFWTFELWMYLKSHSFPLKLRG